MSAPSEDVLAWAKRAGAQGEQAVVKNSLTEAKKFDRIKIAKIMHRQS